MTHIDEKKFNDLVLDLIPETITFLKKKIAQYSKKNDIETSVYGVIFAIVSEIQKGIAISMLEVQKTPQMVQHILNVFDLARKAIIDSTN